MPVDVLSIGHAAFDVSMFVESFPAENSKCEIHDLVEGGGGPAANAAYLLSSWGLSSAFAGVVGDDRYGGQIREEFQSVGTDISLLETRRGHNTPFSVIIVNRQNASRTIINRKVDVLPLHLDVQVAHRLSPKVLLFDGHELEASLQAMEIFPDAISILDAGSLRAGTRELAGRVDYLAASERFALQATGLPDLAKEANQRTCLDTLEKMFKTIVIVTLGEDGLVVGDGNGFQSMPAFPAEAVDTTAAGDIFHGAFAYAMVKGLQFPDGLKLASMAASLSVRVPGGRSSIPKLDRVKEALTRAE